MQSLYVKCRNCESELEHAGDYCMVCNKVNTHLLGVYIDEVAHLFCFYGKEYVGEEIVKLLGFEDEDEKEKQIAYRNSIELISEAIHRKRPKKVIVSGINPKEILQLWNAEVYYTDEFESAEEFKKALREYLTEREIERVNIKPEKKNRWKAYDSNRGKAWMESSVRDCIFSICKESNPLCYRSFKEKWRGFSV